MAAGRRGGGGSLTLGQATGGRPGRVAPSAPRPAPIRQGLGLGLGLNPEQRARWVQASQAGQGGQWLGNHPGVQQRINRVDPTSGRATRIANFMGTGQSQKSAMPQPPTARRRPQGAQSLASQQRPMPLAGPPQQQAPPLPNYGVNQGMQSVLQSRASQGPPPGQAYSGGNMAWNNPQDPNSGYQSQYGGGQYDTMGGFGTQMSQMGGGQYGTMGGFGTQMSQMGGGYQQPFTGQQTVMGQGGPAQQARPPGPGAGMGGAWNQPWTGWGGGGGGASQFGPGGGGAWNRPLPQYGGGMPGMNRAMGGAYQTTQNAGGYL